MKITFYGVRGSVPVSNRETQKFGGNTSCVAIRLNSGKNIVFDAGTGIRVLGRHLMSDDEPIHILLSHSHWDHVIGYPFFQPIYQQNREISIYPSISNIHGQLCSLLDQMDGAHFPIRANQLPSNTRCVLERVDSDLRNQGLNIERKRINHPGGGYGFRVEEDGSSCAYVTDNELEPPGKVDTTYTEWVEFCHGVDVLIHDAQYVEEDMPYKRGWGHSVVSQVWQLAVDAEVGTLVLFHHDPDRSDAMLERIQLDTGVFFDKKGAGVKGLVAREGMSLDT